MPSSNLACWPELLNLVFTTEHRSVLDVGPGIGKGGVLLREYLGDVEVLHAVEAWPQYVSPMMRAIYDAVWVQDVLTCSASWLATYDVVLMVDVIEHFTKEDGLALLKRIHGSVVICTPRDWFDNPEPAWTERHRSLWKVEEFQAMPRVEVAYVNEQAAVIARLGRLPSSSTPTAPRSPT